MFYETIGLLNLEFNVTKRKQIARMVLKAKELLKESNVDKDDQYENDTFNAAQKAAPTNNW